MKLSDELVALLASVGLVQYEYANAPDHSLLLKTRDKLISDVYAQWIIGCQTVRVGKDMSGYNTADVPLADNPLFIELATVEGVTSIAVVPYLAEFRKAEAFDWVELVPKIVEAWKTYQLRKEFALS